MLDHLSTIEGKIGYVFKDKDLIKKALTHASYTNEHSQAQNNERLEFLGDSVLGLVAAERLFLTATGADEGRLTRFKQQLVSKRPLANAIINAGLDSFIIMGKGERLQFDDSRINLSENLFEAIVGAIYLDGGLSSAKDFIFRMLDFDKVIFDQTDKSIDSDHKTALQHHVQKHKLGEITYKVISSSGPPHNPSFLVAVSINSKQIADGQGKSHKKAEQQAAFKALQILTNKE